MEKIDMHCHVLGGSIDASISLKSTVKRLKRRNFRGMVLTDHNSYSGYNLDKIGELSDNFTIILGVEYDTCDAGHILIILPTNNNKDERLEKRGMTLESVSKLVRDKGGVLGFAHPYAHGKFGVGWHTDTVNAKSDDKLTMEKAIELVDFVEVANGTVSSTCNFKAKTLATKYKKVGVAGSDSHRKGTVGLCGTIFKGAIKSNDDIINAIRNEEVTGMQVECSRTSNLKLFTIMFGACEWLYYFVHKVICKINNMKSRCREEEVTNEIK